MKRVLTTIAVSTAMMFAAGIGHAADIKERSAKFPIVNAIDHPQGPVSYTHLTLPTKRIV